MEKSLNLAQPARSPRIIFLLKSFLTLGIVYASYNALRPVVLRSDFVQQHYWKDTGDSRVCPQGDYLTPQVNSNLWRNVSQVIGTDAFKTRAVDWIAGAVRIPTESFDNMDPVDIDPRFEAFKPFHDYLLEAFPLVHSALKLTKVNTYGLFFEWRGSDPSLKPILLAGHQDVVPVVPGTVDQWTHPPYSGFFDGTRIWGRGSFEAKSGLIGIFSALETLLENDFKPTRTVVLAFGFDGEASGYQGAGHLGAAVLEAYGEKGIAMIITGSAGFPEITRGIYGSAFATPGISEKGYLDVLIQVSTPGGHSSLPPAHTSIGILSALLVHLENQPSKPFLFRESPFYTLLQCIGEHATGMNPDMRKLFKRALHSDKALKKLVDVFDTVDNSTTSTTTAIDIIHGGVKANALPEQAWALVNHRIAIHSSIDVVHADDTALLKPLAEKFNLTYNAFGKSISQENASASGSLTLSDAFDGGFGPAPTTPIGHDAAPFQLLSGTIRATFKSHRTNVTDGTDGVIVSPGLLPGNSDTRYYWNVSDHIFRYNHHNYQENLNPAGSLIGGIHTVNEFLEVDAFLEMIRFFATLVLNADESRSM